MVLGKPIDVVAEKVSPHIRLPLLAPEELSRVEEQNRKDNLLHVRALDYKWLTVRACNAE